MAAPPSAMTARATLTPPPPAATCGGSQRSLCCGLTFSAEVLTSSAGFIVSVMIGRIGEEPMAERLGPHGRVVPGRKSRHAEGAGPCGPTPRVLAAKKLLENLRDLAGTHGAATLTDGEAEALLHRDRLDQLDRDVG